MKVSICAIFRNESRYLREWIEFHRIVGVDTFWLYQNRSDDDYQSVIRPYMEQGIVQLTQWPMEPPSQFAAYQHCIDQRNGAEEWIAFIDCDEFLFSPRYNTVTEALKGLPVCWGAIGVNWMCFGSSGKQEWEDVPVIERFTWRPNDQSSFNLHIKSMIHMDQEVRVSGTPHHFHVARGTYSENGDPLGGPFTHRHSSSLLRINHYCSKSRQEWLDRVKLGKPDRATMSFDPDWYDKRQDRDVNDREIQRFLPEVKKRLA